MRGVTLQAAALNAMLAVRRELADPVKNELVPREFSLDSQPRVLNDQVIGDGLVRPCSLAMVGEPGGLGAQRPDPVLDASAQRVLVQIAAHRHGQVNGVRTQPDLRECLTSEHPQLTKALVGDRVDRPGGQVPRLLRPHRLDQALGRKPVQRSVQRSWPDVGPHVCPVKPRVAPQLMPVHRPVLRQRPKDKQPSRIHRPSKARLLTFDYSPATSY